VPGGLALAWLPFGQSLHCFSTVSTASPLGSLATVDWAKEKIAHHLM
jgi:hypothetical protein